MTKKEQLKMKIEEERRKLNELLSRGASVEDTYLQSLVVDRLLEDYMEFQF